MTLNSQIPGLGRHFVQVVHLAQVCFPGPWSRKQLRPRGAGDLGDGGPLTPPSMVEPQAPEIQNLSLVCPAAGRPPRPRLHVCTGRRGPLCRVLTVGRRGSWVAEGWLEADPWLSRCSHRPPAFRVPVRRVTDRSAVNDPGHFGVRMMGGNWVT